LSTYGPCAAQMMKDAIRLIDFMIVRLSKWTAFCSRRLVVLEKLLHLSERSDSPRSLIAFEESVSTQPQTQGFSSLRIWTHTCGSFQIVIEKASGKRSREQLVFRSSRVSEFGEAPTALHAQEAEKAAIRSRDSYLAPSCIIFYLFWATSAPYCRASES
jgi:hypothetical protein